MENTDKKSLVGKMLLQSSMDEQQKQKLLFALPKMDENDVEELAGELEDLRKVEQEKIHSELDQQLATEGEMEQGLESLYGQMGTDRKNVAGGSEEDVQVSNEMLEEIARDPKKLTALLIAIGPKEIKRLEKAIRRLAADPNYHFTAEEIEDTAEKLRSFAADTYQTAKQIDQELRKQELVEQIHLEKEKQQVLQEYINDLEVISQQQK